MRVLLLLILALHIAKAQECSDLHIVALNAVRNVDGTFSCYHPSQRLVEAVCTEHQHTPAYCGANIVISVAETNKDTPYSNGSGVSTRLPILLR